LGGDHFDKFLTNVDIAVRVVLCKSIEQFTLNSQTFCANYVALSIEAKRAKRSGTSVEIGYVARFLKIKFIVFEGNTQHPELGLKGSLANIFYGWLALHAWSAWLLDKIRKDATSIF